MCWYMLVKLIIMVVHPEETISTIIMFKKTNKPKTDTVTASKEAIQIIQFM